MHAHSSRTTDPSAGDPAVAAPDPARTDPRPQWERAAAAMAALFGAVRPEQLQEPTPCAEFAVGDLLSHVVGGTLRIARVAEDRPVADEPAARGDSGVVGVPEDGWSEPYARACERFAAAWADDAKLDTPTTVPWGTVPGRFAVGGAVMETTVHAWDLARAIGREDLLDSGTVGFALAVAERAVPAERAADIPFAPPLAPPEGADDYGRLVSWLGRRWSPATAQGRDRG